jgi:hypothetical protein
MNPRYPIYVISKGRWKLRQTSKALEAMRVPYRIVVEPQELAQYAAVIDRAKILVLPFSNLGQGSIPARNWVWEHSISEGHARHWIMDDNIWRFYRFNRNAKIPAGDGSIFRASEDFTDRFANVPMSGLQYESFAKRRCGDLKPFVINTRVYSCILLSNSVPHRWRGRYNEDTDLSLRFLKDGYCTILFYAFLANKVATMRLKRGNTDELYRQDKQFDGRLEMACSLQRQHPDVTKVVWKFGRWQHHVDYRPFAKNRLILRPGVEVKPGTDDYGMVLRTVDQQAGARKQTPCPTARPVSRGERRPA